MRLKKCFCMGMVLSLFLINTKVFANEQNIFNDRKDILPDKIWTVEFNCSLNKNTINNKNIIVTDAKGNKLDSNVMMDSNDKKIKIIPKTEGYIPGNDYYLNIGQDVESIGGKKLKDKVKMKFTTKNTYLDGSNYEGLPKVDNVKMKYEPILPDENQVFYIDSKDKNVEYRVYTSRYTYSLDKFGAYEEVTNGYTSLKNGGITSNKTFKSTSDSNKYKVLIYVKAKGRKGIYKDSNTDFDNYYIDYFRVSDKRELEDVDRINYDKGLKQTLDKQYGDKVSVTDEGPSSWVGASKNQIKYYLNPKNFTDEYGKYIFLKLDYVDDSITENDLNGILKSKGSLENKGKYFLMAANENHISPIYLISHALHETGNGMSNLAKGIEVDGAEGKKTVYNMYGIGAVDKDPDKCGSEFAYKKGWFTVEDAIVGGAKFISSRYINNGDLPKNTLYEMRWNPYTPGAYQYATDIGWAYKQVRNIKALMDKCSNPTLKFKMPVYKE